VVVPDDWSGLIRLIAAIDRFRGIAGPHGIPWQGKLPTDARYFSEQTATGVIVMGHRTYEEFDRPLHDRPNVVVCRPGSPALRPGFIGVSDLTLFLQEQSQDVVWVLGGGAIFQEALPLADELFVTQLDEDFHCTKFFPPFDDHFVLATTSPQHTENDISFRFEVWRRSDDQGDTYI
jgi:dihydrofolate reductase